MEHRANHSKQNNNGNTIFDTRQPNNPPVISEYKTRCTTDCARYDMSCDQKILSLKMDQRR